MAMGVLVCVGWLTGNTALVHILPEFAGMQFNTALGFVLAGGFLVAAVAVVVLGGLTALVPAR